jgi:hypothetical protein
MATINILQSEIEEILDREDVCWKQCAKRNWYLNGDKNTQFFYSWANHRRKINSIKIITDANGRVLRHKKKVSKHIIDYFGDLFTTLGPVGIVHCMDSVEPRVTNEMNSGLLRPFVAEEVRMTLFQMHPLKSPNPNGFSNGLIKILGTQWVRILRGLHFISSMAVLLMQLSMRQIFA